MTRYLYTSVTRISRLPELDFTVAALPRREWGTGDYVVAEVHRTASLNNIELPNGRMMEVAQGDLLVGALGARAATLEAVGHWCDMDTDRCDLLTPAGLFGKLTSSSPFLLPLPVLKYVGHVAVGGDKQTMTGSMPPVPEGELAAPMVLITGTSMSSGKTMSGRLIVRILSRLGYRVIGAKLTGAARYRDVLSFEDAGAAEVFDFVDVGLPSTVVDEAQYRSRLEWLLRRIAAARPDVVVAEAGASPLEPYNGSTAMSVLGERVRFNLLCASDPYAVAGVVAAFERQPELVAGGAANTDAGIELVRKLTGLRAANLLSKDQEKPLTNQLLAKLGLN